MSKYSTEIDFLLDWQRRELEERKAAKEKARQEMKAFEVVGKFQLKSGKVRITDPCYDLGTWCAGTLKNVAKGGWIAAVTREDQGDWGIRVTSLLAWHNDYTKTVAIDAIEDTKIDVGVDSGQAGIFDLDMYPIGTLEPKRMAEFNGGKYNAEFDEFYEAIAEFTLGPKGAGVIAFGAASSSGDGDGGYPCFISRNKDGEIIGIKIDYYPSYEED